jgi:hypothetical protein
MRTKFITSLLFVSLLCFTTVFALSVTPARGNFYLLNQQDIDGEFTVFASSDGFTKITISVSGELKDLVEFENNVKTIDGQGKFQYKLLNVKSFEKPGFHTAVITINEEKVDSGTVSAKPSVSYTINLFVPYPGKYLDTKLIAYEDDPYILKFTTVVDNKGSQTVYNIENEINIYEGNEKLASLYKAEANIDEFDVIKGYKIPGTTEEKVLALPKKTFSLKPNEKVDYEVEVKKVYFEVGEYEAESFIFYAGEKKTDRKQFKIGKEKIYFNQLNSYTSVNEITGLIYNVKSNWNKDIKNIYLTGSLFKDGSKIKDIGPSNNFEIEPNKETMVTLYLDGTSLLINNTYDLQIDAHYNDKIFSDEFVIIAAEKEVVAEKEIDLPTSSSYLFTITVITLLIIIAIIIFLVVKRMINRGEEFV